MTEHLFNPEILLMEFFDYFLLQKSYFTDSHTPKKTTANPSIRIKSTGL